MGGLFLDFEAVRTESSDRDAPRRFAERVDLIVLLFDPFKLDISDELTGVIRRFRGHEDKVRVVLNKSADSASV